MPKMNKYDKAHLVNLQGYQRKIDKLYQSMLREAALLGASVGKIKGDTLFSFADYPTISKRAERLFSTLKEGVYSVIVNGIDAEWTLANNKNNELAQRVFGDNVGKLSQAQYRRYFSTNDTAREAFIDRKEQGLNLSDRVWKYTDQFKTEIELGLDFGIRNGQSAADLARDLQQYLQQPDRLFRRVRDEHGNLKLSKAAQAYHSGQGVYRSSYKNARRLAATETNIAYRTADYERWQQLDFVVGIEIKLSNNHTTTNSRGQIVPLTDICDELAGRYPKDFKFTGWHPHCRCHALAILKTEKEMEEDTRRILDGEAINGESVNKVDDVPQAFKDWLKDNAERSERTYSKPYFITDNEKYIPKRLREAYGSKLPYSTYAEYEQAMLYNRKHGGFSTEQLKNIKELNAILPVIQGQIMPFAIADHKRPNPNFTLPNARDLGYKTNCQTCTLAYELRRRGFDVEALASPKGTAQEYWAWAKQNGITFDNNFLTADGNPATFTYEGYCKTVSSREAFINRETKTVGRYEVLCSWKPNSKGIVTSHVFIVERQESGYLLWYDPQSGLINDKIREYYLESMHDTYAVGVRRIDDKLINPKLAERLRKSAH